jgi:amidophosphoribosyltransferase
LDNRKNSRKIIGKKKFINSFSFFKGAFSIVAMSRKKLFAFRDPDGFRPLVLGKINNEYVICSESCALDTVDAQYIRDIKPGELITIDDQGLKSTILIGTSTKTIFLCL